MNFGHFGGRFERLLGLVALVLLPQLVGLFATKFRLDGRAGLAFGRGRRRRRRRRFGGRLVGRRRRRDGHGDESLAPVGATAAIGGDLLPQAAVRRRSLVGAGVQDFVVEKSVRNFRGPAGVRGQRRRRRRRDLLDLIKEKESKR